LKEKNNNRNWAYAVGFVVFLLALYFLFGSGFEKKNVVTLSQVANEINAEKVDSMTVEGDQITLKMKDGLAKTSQIGTTQPVTSTLKDLGADPKKVNLALKDSQDSSTFWLVVFQIVPIILIVGFFWYMLRQAQGANNQAMMFSRSKAKVFDPTKEKVTFTDVTGAEEAISGKREIFTSAAQVLKFESFDEKIPGTSVAFKMVAVPGGKFKMGTPDDEPYRQPEEGPQIDVAVDSFWMGEIEVSWSEYLAFFNATSSQGRKEAVATEEKSETDAITGATPPWGAPDQGWGKGTRPAITMSYLAAETYCRWLSQVTGKKYRLPTEAEWEYAARANTNTAYFFGGSPKDFETDGFFKKIFGADTTVINSYVIYTENSPSKTQEPAMVKANAFGLKNMLGNVAEFCLDFYDPAVYSKYPKTLVQNPRGPRNGMKHVIRGGPYNY